MNAIRTQVEEEDLGAFDDKVKHMADKALDEIKVLWEVIDRCEASRNESCEEGGSVSPKLSDIGI